MAENAASGRTKWWTLLSGLMHQIGYDEDKYISRFSP